MAGTCKTCGKTLGRDNKSGFCRKHFNAAEHDPTWRERHARAVRRHYADPANLEAAKERARVNGKSPGATAARRAAALRTRLWEMGHRALEGDADARARAGRHRSRTVLAGIPEEQWDTYRLLVKRKHMPAAEAREACLRQNETHLARIRRELTEAQS